MSTQSKSQFVSTPDQQARDPRTEKFDMEKNAPKRNEKGEQGQKRRGTVLVREYEPADKPQVQLIFYEGLMEMVQDTAFRGLRHHPESVLLYAAVTGEATRMKEVVFSYSGPRMPVI